MLLSKSVVSTVEKNDLAGLKAAVEEGMWDIQQSGGHKGGTFLHYSTDNGQVDIATYLLDHQANIRAVEIHVATIVGQLDIVKELVRRKSNVNSKDHKKITPLHLAAWWGQTAIAGFLIENGADVDTRSKTGYLPLHYACLEGHVDIVKVLVHAGSDIKRTNDNGYTPLHHASWKGHYSVAEYLIKNGADVNSKNRDGYSPLHYSCAYGHGDIVQLLLSKGCDIGATTNDGSTPLHIAAAKGFTSVVDYLIQHGVAVGARCKDGWLALHYACSGGCLDTMQLLIRQGSDVLSETNDGNTPLHIALKDGRTSTAEYLIQNGARINCRNRNGYMPLHYACHNGLLGFVELLLLDCNNRPSGSGSSYLELACQNGHAEVVKTLFDHGIDFGKTGLCRAAYEKSIRRGHCDLAIVLREKMDMNQAHRTTGQTFWQRIRGTIKKTSKTKLPPCEKEKEDKDGQPTSPPDREPRINDLNSLVRQDICKKLDIIDDFGGDFRRLAAHFEMSSDDIDLIAQRPNATHKVLQWAGRNPNNTVAKLRNILLEMERMDCVEILDKDQSMSN